MLPAERRARVLDLVIATGVISTEELATSLDVSTETIRRDLLALEKRGQIVRVHGGAARFDQSVATSEPSFDVRSSAGIERKERIAQVAAGLVPDGSLVMLDVGTTALLVARALPMSLAATVVTTSLRAAVELADRPGIDVLVAGGRVRGGDLAVSGMTTADFLGDMNFDIALLGSGGLHEEAGLTDYYLEEAQVRRSVIARSKSSFVLCDSSKFGTIARHRVATWGDFTGIVTDERPQKALRSAAERSNTKVLTAD